MINFFILILLLISYIKIYISLSKFFRFKKTFNILEKFLVPILVFEIITILISFIFPSLNILMPTILHFVGVNFKFLGISFFSIFYLIINISLIITSIDLNDNLVPIYNFILAIHFITSSFFTLYLF